MTATIQDDEVEEVLKSFHSNGFTTFDFIKKLQELYPSTWSNLEEEYGPGGRGAGRHYSAYSRTSQVLNNWVRGGRLKKSDYEPAPNDWGNPVIRRWFDPNAAAPPLSPIQPLDEVDEDGDHWEGAVDKILVNRYERDALARKKCIEHYEAICQVCQFDFEKRYGPLGRGFIHVHHRVPISMIGEKYKVDPINDLVPVCPNCHAMLHRESKALEIEDLRRLLISS